MNYLSLSFLLDLLDTISLINLFLRIPYKCQWFWRSRGPDEVVELGEWYVAFSNIHIIEMVSGIMLWEIQLFQPVQNVECIHGWIWNSEIVDLKHSAEKKRRVLGKLKISLAVESFWYSSIVIHPASDLYAIMINLFLVFSLLLMDVSEEWTVSASLFLTWWIDSSMSSKISTLKWNCFLFPICLKLYSALS